MSNNNSNNSGSGQINIPFPTIPATPAVPAGGWYVFQTSYTPSPFIGIDMTDGAVPVEEKKINKDGCNCKKCKEFYPYAEANQEDGTLICYSCRKGF